MTNATASDRPARSLVTIVLSRMIVPLCFGALAVTQIVSGVDSLPVWLTNFAGRFEINPTLVLRVMLAAELAGVCVMLLLDRAARGAAVALLTAACFVLVAEIAATRVAPGLALRMLMLAAGAVMLWLLSAPGETRSAARTTVPQLVCGLAGIGAAIAVAAVVPLKSEPVEVVGKAHLATPLAPPKPPAEPARPKEPIVELVRDVPAAQLPNRMYLLEPETWLLRRVADLDWAAFLPEVVLADLTQESGGTKYIVFYRPDSDVCVQVFENYVSRTAPNRAYALRFPPAPQSGSPEPELVKLPCPNCILVAMPKGPLWFTEVPVLLRVTNGVVTCMARGSVEVDYETCVGEGN